MTAPDSVEAEAEGAQSMPTVASSPGAVLARLERLADPPKRPWGATGSDPRELSDDILPK